MTSSYTNTVEGKIMGIEDLLHSAFTVGET